MPEESAQSQPTVLTQPPSRSPFKIILFVLFGLVVLVLVAEGIYFLRLRKGRETFVPTIPPKPEQALKETIDILTLPGWTAPEIKINPDGSLQILSEPISYWYIVDNEAVHFRVKGDFEAQFGIATAGRQNPKDRQWGNVVFYNSHFAKEANRVQVGITKRNELYVSFYDDKKKETINLLGYIPAPTSGNLRVRFENVGTATPEEVIVYDEDIGKELGRTLLPQPLFFSQELYLGLRLANVTNDPKGAEMTVSHFRILGNITKI